MANMTHGHKVIFGERGEQTRRDAETLCRIFPPSLGDTSAQIAYILAHRFVPVTTIRPDVIITVPPHTFEGEPVLFWGVYDTDYVTFDGEFFTVFSRKNA